MKMKLSSIALVIRSKNAGPFKLTLDIVLPSEECLEEVFPQITKELVAKIYNIRLNEVLSIIKYRPANTLKINIMREIPAGNPGDTDVYGAQQHAPLLYLEVDVSKKCLKALEVHKK